MFFNASIKRYIFTVLIGVLITCSPAKSEISDSGFSNTSSLPPQRIVSLDYCADQYVLKFVTPEHVVALSRDADASFSYMQERARTMPEKIMRTRPDFENIVRLNPDLVVRSYGGGAQSAIFYKRLGIKVLQINPTQTLADIKKENLRLARILGTKAQQEALNTYFDTHHNHIKMATQTTAKHKLLYTSPAGISAGKNTLIDEIIHAAGYENYDTRKGWHALDLEALHLTPPDKLAFGFWDIQDSYKDNWSLARHSIFKNTMANTPTTPLAGSWTACGGWFIFDAIHALIYPRIQAHPSQVEKK